MSRTVWPGALALVFAITLPATALAAGSEVQSGGTLDSYFGPLGVGIASDGTQPVQGSGSSWFRDRASGLSSSFAPTDPYNNYPWPAFGQAGTGFVQLVGGPGTAGWIGSGGIDFWTLEGNTPLGPGDINSLVFTPSVSSNVTLDPLTHRSNLFKIATLAFTNGTWFGSSPPIDPGNGPLYTESVFGVSLTALPDPQIGTPTFPWGGHQWNGTLTLTSTFGPNTPDYVSLTSLGSFPSGYFAVNEGATGSIEVWGRLGSLLALEYRNPVNGSIVSEIPISPVPEPALYLQLLLGLGVLLASRNKRKGSMGSDPAFRPPRCVPDRQDPEGAKGRT